MSEFEVTHTHTHKKEKKNCLASSSFDLKCAKSNPCRSDVVPRMTAHQHHVHPQSFTWNLKMMVSNRNLLFQWLIFRFHVKLQGCTTSKLLQPSQTQGLQSPRPSAASWPPWCHFEAFEALGPRNPKRRAWKLGRFFFSEKTPYQNMTDLYKGSEWTWKFTNKISKRKFWKISPKLHDFWVPDVDLQGCICTWHHMTQVPLSSVAF